MSNTYFRFKQFTIHQDRCAMKVSTDACIQGAWTPVSSTTKRILDIGTGTALLSLMLAQKKNELNIDAIELETEAASQAAENVANSPWRDNISVLRADAVTFNYAHQYDLIISNPPFFNNSLLGPAVQRNNARHTLTLSYQNLFDVFNKCLVPGGLASVLLPSDTLLLWQDILTHNNWQVQKKLLVHPRVGQAANRVVVLCSQNSNSQTVEEHLFIKEEGDTYTADFNKLMMPYYLDK